MKRTLLIGLALLFMVSALVVGCSSEKKAETPAPAAEVAAPAAAPAAEVAAPAAAPAAEVAAPAAAPAAPAKEEKKEEKKK